MLLPLSLLSSRQINEDVGSFGQYPPNQPLLPGSWVVYEDIRSLWQWLLKTGIDGGNKEDVLCHIHKYMHLTSMRHDYGRGADLRLDHRGKKVKMMPTMLVTVCTMAVRGGK